MEHFRQLVVREAMQLECEPLAVRPSINFEALSGRFCIANRECTEEKKDFMPDPCDGIANRFVPITRGMVRREIDGVVGSRISSLTNHNKAFVVQELGLLEYIVPTSKYQSASKT